MPLCLALALALASWPEEARAHGPHLVTLKDFALSLLLPQLRPFHLSAIILFMEPMPLIGCRPKALGPRPWRVPPTSSCYEEYYLSKGTSWLLGTHRFHG